MSVGTKSLRATGTLKDLKSPISNNFYLKISDNLSKPLGAEWEDPESTSCITILGVTLRIAYLEKAQIGTRI